MAKRGPGKFDSDLDAALYEIALNGADGEVGSSSGPPGAWAGLIRRGTDTARAIEGAQRDSVAEGGGFHDVSKQDLDFLRTKGKAGSIIIEHDSGRVEVAYYEAEADLEKDWEQVMQDLDVDEEFEENSRPRRNGKLPKAYSKYGADMGRRSDKVSGEVTLERIQLDSGGYDGGGAYWGTGTPLWRAQDADGNEKFFRAKDREAAEVALGTGVTIGRGEWGRQGDASTLEDDGTLLQLLESAAESNELPGEHQRDLQVTPELSRAFVDWEEELHKVLSRMVGEYPPKHGRTAADLMDDGQAPYLVLMTLQEAGVGIRDGDWDKFYDDEDLDKVEEYLESRLGKWAGSGGGKLDMALDDAVYENASRLGLERDDEGNWEDKEGEDDGDEQEQNRRTPNGSNAWRVMLRGEETDVVFFDDRMDAEEVRRSLIEHDGYDPAIKVKLRERRRTRAPDALAENARGTTGVADEDKAKEREFYRRRNLVGTEARRIQGGKRDFTVELWNRGTFLGSKTEFTKRGKVEQVLFDVPKLSADGLFAEFAKGAPAEFQKNAQRVR